MRVRPRRDPRPGRSSHRTPSPIPPSRGSPFSRHQSRPANPEPRTPTPGFYIGGIHPVELVLQTGRVKALFGMRGREAGSRDEGRFSRILRAAGERGVPTPSVEPEQLDELFPGLHQGIVALVNPKPYIPFEGVLSSLSSRATGLLLALDHIQDPQNFGAILRSAAAFGVLAVIIPKDRAVGITPAVYKSSAGYVEMVDVAQVANIRYALGALKDKGVWTVALNATGPRGIDQMNTTRPLCLVIGAEGKGVSPVVLKEVDEVVRIPLAPVVESLNSSAAAAIALFAATTRP
ncbi:MAG: 23S rRNA (guanosine(2251)-2'-O)-methyltransferase RlmB [bacterium]